MNEIDVCVWTDRGLGVAVTGKRYKILSRQFSRRTLLCVCEYMGHCLRHRTYLVDDEKSSCLINFPELIQEPGI